VARRTARCQAYKTHDGVARQALALATKAYDNGIIRRHGALKRGRASSARGRAAATRMGEGAGVTSREGGAMFLVRA